MSKVKPRYKKGEVVKLTTQICRKLTAEELEYLLSVCNTNFSDKVAELLHNTCLNDSIFNKLEKLKKFKSLRATLVENKTNIVRVLNTRSPQRRRMLLREQAGSGIITGIASFLALALPAIIATAKTGK